MGVMGTLGYDGPGVIEALHLFVRFHLLIYAHEL